MSFPFAAATAAEVRDACGNDASALCRLAMDLTGNRTIASLADSVLAPSLSILLIVVAAFVVNKLARRAIKRGLRAANSNAVQGRLSAVKRVAPAALLETNTHEVSVRSEQRVESLSSVLRSVVSFGIFIVAGFMILGEVGIELGPLLAGAGIVGVALGFGAQSLVGDFLSGIFILVEDQFGVGDDVNLDNETIGVVEGVSLRTTRVRAIDGTLWHIPNGEIRRAGNASQHWSRSLLDVDVAYDTDLDLAQDVIRAAATALWRSDDAILEEPSVWGVQELGPSAITIRLVVKTTPASQFRISRELRRRIKDAFDEHGIEIPFPQATVWHRQEVS